MTADDIRDRLDAVEALAERHKPMRIYDECDHPHQDGEPGVVDTGEFLTCEEEYLYSICRWCCVENPEYPEQAEWCNDRHFSEHKAGHVCDTAALVAAVREDAATIEGLRDEVERLAESGARLSEQVRRVEALADVIEVEIAPWVKPDQPTVVTRIRGALAGGMSPPPEGNPPAIATPREMNALRTVERLVVENARLMAQVRRVEALHTPTQRATSGSSIPGHPVHHTTYCPACAKPYPCATAAALATPKAES